jgi:hypothetical protein
MLACCNDESKVKRDESSFGSYTNKKKNTMFSDTVCYKDCPYKVGKDLILLSNVK